MSTKIDHTPMLELTADTSRLDEDARGILFDAILHWPYTRMEQFRTLLDRFCRASVNDQQNFHEAMGR